MAWRTGLALVAFLCAGTLGARGALGHTWREQRKNLTNLPTGESWKGARALFKKVDRKLGNSDHVESLEFFPRSHGAPAGNDPRVHLFRVRDTVVRVEQRGDVWLYGLAKIANQIPEVMVVIWDGKKWHQPPDGDIAIGRRFDDLINQEEDTALKQTMKKGGLPRRQIPRGSLFLENALGVP